MQTSIDTFVAAATVAGHAPSIHNSQPWRWVAQADALDLFRENNFRLRATDPDDRLSTLSCGAALHHARIALAAEGYATEVARLPDPLEPNHLAHLTMTDDMPGTEDATGARQAIETRHADRRPSAGTRIDADQLGAVTAAAACEGASLYVLPSDAVTELAAATANAQWTEALEPEWQAELAYWAGGTRPGGADVPDSTIPQRPTETAVSSREFGRPGSPLVRAADDEAAAFAIVYGAQDEAIDWLRAGEGVSAAWLAAVGQGVSVLPMSATIEVDATRLALRRLLAGRASPTWCCASAGPSPKTPTHRMRTGWPPCSESNGRWHDRQTRHPLAGWIFRYAHQQSPRLSFRACGALGGAATAGPRSR